MRLLLLLALLLPAEDPPLPASLAEAVDLPDPSSRAEAALRLSRRPDATVDVLLAAMATFGRFDPVKAGAATATVPLFDGKASADGEVTVYTPPGYDPAKPAPLLLALHGAGGHGREEHLRWKGTADALGMIVLAPTDRARDKGYRFSAEERERALSALRWARRRWNVDENRILGTGISAGGHLLWDLALRRPDLFAGIAPMIGGPRLSNAAGENNARFLENLRRLPVRDLQGAQDDPLLLSGLRRAFERLEGWGNGDARLLEFRDLGHDFDMAAVDWQAWFGGLRRDPSPAEVVRMAVEEGEGRAFGAEILATGKGAKATFTLKVGPEWNGLPEEEKRERFAKAMDERTARLRVVRKGPGLFEAEGREVDRFRVLLRAGDFEAGKPVVVAYRGRSVKGTVRPDPRVLLAEFVERFDRTFLPVAEVKGP